MNQRQPITAQQRLLIAKAHLRQWTPFARTNANGTVIVFPDYRIAYVPVPKCANSSIRAALLPLIGLKPEDVPRIQEFQGFHKVSMIEYVRWWHGEDWYTFTAVRDPFSRYASAFLDKLETRHEPLRPLRRMGLKKGDSFALFMSMLRRWPESALNEHFAPQTTILRHILRLPNLEIAKVETLAAEWPAIAGHITSVSGMAIPALETRNSAKARLDWRSLYDRNTIALAQEMAAEDFRRLGYSAEFAR